jgi:hypothetical protein
MPLRLFHRVRVAPGLRVNLSKTGVSLSVGRKGAWYTSGRRGQRVTAGWPGTGLFWMQQLPPSPVPRARHRVALAIMALFGISMLVWAMMAAPH